MSNIRATVTETLRARGQQSYLSYAEPVIAALERREAEVVRGLRQYAERRGLRGQEVDSLFVEVGLAERPAPAPMNAAPSTSGDDSDLFSAVRDLTVKVNSLIDAARRNGITISV